MKPRPWAQVGLSFHRSDSPPISTSAALPLSEKGNARITDEKFHSPSGKV